MDLIHYEDENSRYITIGCVEKPLCMLACWVEDPNGIYFKKHLARVVDCLWVGEDGMKLQGVASQTWDASLLLQALLATNLYDEIGPTLMKGHNFLKNSQVRDNPPGDFKRMFRHISKGSWTFADQDHGWQVSDCTAESLKLSKMMMENGQLGNKNHQLVVAFAMTEPSSHLEEINQ
ncbi:Beta-Amyrin Synthase 1 [Gossypium arboreum]|uniref:Beta-Amyrin Synthase 1 n=1 Tax=Gossypium arboreum TaxID=29729 RepID=A0A0B0NSC6_GOSAR|nr:Beta-Amyrin Synthase 1 [Gossypium arboreum]